MVSPELIKFLEDRFSEGKSVSYVKKVLRENQKYDEIQFDDAMNNILVNTQKPQSAKVEKLIINEKNKNLFIYSLLMVGMILIIFGFSSLNARRNFFPGFLGFVLICIAFGIYAGKENIKKFLQDVDKFNTERKGRL